MTPRKSSSLCECAQRNPCRGHCGDHYLITYLASCRNLALRSGGSVSRQDFTATRVLSTRRRPLNTSPKFPCNGPGFLPILSGPQSPHLRGQPSGPPPAFPQRPIPALQFTPDWGMEGVHMGQPGNVTADVFTKKN